MKYWLATFRDDFGPTSISGFELFSDVTRQQFMRMANAHMADEACRIPLGDEDELAYDDLESLMQFIDWKEITKEQANVISGVFNGTPNNTIAALGIFPKFDNFDSLKDEDFEHVQGQSG